MLYNQRNIGNAVTLADACLLSFNLTNTFNIGDIVVIGRSEGGLMYGQITSSKSSNQCPLDADRKTRQIVGWIVQIKTKDETVEKLLPTCSVGKILPLSAPSAVPVELNRTSWKIKNDFEFGERVIVPRSSGGFSLGTVESGEVRNHGCSFCGDKHPYKVWTVKFEDGSTKNVPAILCGKIISCDFDVCIDPPQIYPSGVVKTPLSECDTNIPSQMQIKAKQNVTQQQQHQQQKQQQQIKNQSELTKEEIEPMVTTQSVKKFSQPEPRILSSPKTIAKPLPQKPQKLQQQEQEQQEQKQKKLIKPLSTTQKGPQVSSDTLTQSRHSSIQQPSSSGSSLFQPLVSNSPQVQHNSLQIRSSSPQPQSVSFQQQQNNSNQYRSNSPQPLNNSHLNKKRKQNELESSGHNNILQQEKNKIQRTDTTTPATTLPPYEPFPKKTENIALPVNGTKNELPVMILDAPNIAFRHGNHSTFSVSGIEIALRHFDEMGFHTIGILPDYFVNINPSRPPKQLPSDVPKLQALHKANRIFSTPVHN